MCMTTSGQEKSALWGEVKHHNKAISDHSTSQPTVHKWPREGCIPVGYWRAHTHTLIHSHFLHVICYNKQGIVSISLTGTINTQGHTYTQCHKHILECAFCLKHTNMNFVLWYQMWKKTTSEPPGTKISLSIFTFKKLSYRPYDYSETSLLRTSEIGTPL